MKRFKPLLLIAFAALAGCESMSVSECQVADWGRVGLADGSRGESESRLSAYTEDCGKSGIRPNAKAYRQGWDVGIARFCTATNGWREGTQGHSGKEAVCRGQSGFNEFSHFLNAGLHVYRTNEQMRHNTQETNQLQNRLEKPGSDDEKRRIRSQLREIDYEQSRLRSQLSRQQMAAP